MNCVAATRRLCASASRLHGFVVIEGVEASQSLIKIAQRQSEGKSVWRINYGTKEYIGQRGGDLIIDVDSADYSIEKVLRGQ